jgi:cytochrome c553
MKKLFATLIACGLLSAGGAMANDGRRLYEEFQCANCHGVDARTEKTVNIPKLAGRNADELKTRFMATKPHDEVMKDCGETPNHVQVKEMSQYLSTLQR